MASAIAAATLLEAVPCVSMCLIISRSLMTLIVPPVSRDTWFISQESWPSVSPVMSPFPIAFNVSTWLFVIHATTSPSLTPRTLVPSAAYTSPTAFSAAAVPPVSCVRAHTTSIQTKLASTAIPTNLEMMDRSLSLVFAFPASTCLVCPLA
jgi:hypothetical protein